MALSSHSTLLMKMKDAIGAHLPHFEQPHDDHVEVVGDTVTL